MRKQPLWWLVFLSIFLAFSLRGWVLFRTEQPLNVDEQYYLSTAANAANGYGFYPTTNGLQDIPIYSGNGYGVMVYTAAYELIGPSIHALRLVSWVFGLIALPAVFLSSRILYGRHTALLALALFPWLFFFVISNSARFDTPTIAYVAWMLYLVLFAFERRRGWLFHFLIGIGMGLGLQVHLNTTVVAVSFGFLYLLEHWRAARNDGNWVTFRAPVLAYVLGYAVAAALFLLFNILPDSEAFFDVLRKLRVWDTDNYSGTNVLNPDASLFESIFNLPLIFERESIRYRWLLRDVPVFEVILAALGIFALLLRREREDNTVSALLLGGVLSLAFIFVNESYYYMQHLLPILFLPVPALIVRGFDGDESPPLRPAVFVALIAAMMSASGGLITGALGLRDVENDPPEPVYVEWVHRLADRHDWLAGTSEDFVQYFGRFPRYVSHGATQQALGMLFQDAETPLDYWQFKSPDYVFGFTDFDAISTYVTEADYVSVVPGLVAHPDLWFAQPDFDDPLADFGDQLRLLGAATQTETIASCETLYVHTQWQTLVEDVPGSVSVGVHLLDDRGVVVAQADAPPANYTLDQWAQFLYLPDMRALELPCELSSGDYTLVVVAYDANTLERLLITNSDFVTIATIQVTQ